MELIRMSETAIDTINIPYDTRGIAERVFNWLFDIPNEPIKYVKVPGARRISNCIIKQELTEASLDLGKTYTLI